MKARLHRLLLFVAAFVWGISAIGVIASWDLATTLLRGLGAGPIPADPMLDYWLRMASGAFTTVGLLFLAFAIRPRAYANVIPLVSALMILEGLVILAHGIRLHLPPLPFFADAAACILIGAGIWITATPADNKD